jgi:hypothetical protein
MYRRIARVVQMPSMSDNGVDCTSTSDLSTRLTPSVGWSPHCRFRLASGTIDTVHPTHAPACSDLIAGDADELGAWRA